MNLNLGPEFDRDFELARRAVERRWLVAGDVEAAMLASEESPGSRLRSHLSLTPDQIRELETPSESRIPEEVQKAATDPARRIDHYVLLEDIGQGGMGRVHRAWDLNLSRWVALKFLRSVGDRRAEAHFEREAKLAASLSHPNIAAIYELGQAKGERYIAMQLVRGTTLESLPRQNLKSMVGLVRDAAGAVAFAHAQGVIHRDLKPSNVMATPEGQVYVMDFGLARPVEGDGGRSTSLGVVGTPAYMSPEQARGGTADERSDVYGLGATLYELLTGRVPFKGRHVYEVLRKVEEQDPIQPRKLNARIPVDLETIVLKCLEKDPARRYETAVALVEDIDRWLAGDPVHARTRSLVYRIRRRLAKHKAIAGAAISLLLLALGSIWWLTVGSPSSRSAREMVEGMKAWEHLVPKSYGDVDHENLRRMAGRAREFFERSNAAVENAHAHMMRGKCLILEGQREQALMAFKQAVRVEPASSAARLELCKMLLLEYRSSRGTTAEEYSSRPGRIRFSALRPENEAEKQLRLQAESHLQGIDVPAERADLLKALIEMGHGSYEVAAQHFARHIQLDPLDSGSMRLQAICLYHAGRFVEAQKPVLRALALVRDAVGLHLSGLIGLELREFDRALEDFIEAARLNPTYAGGFNSLGRANMELKKPVAAIENFDEAIRLNANFTQAIINRAVARTELNQFAQALVDLERALKLDPKEARALTNRAIVRLSAKDYQGAIEDCDLAIDSDAQHLGAYINRGVARMRMKDFKRAVDDFTQAITIDPEDPGPRYNRATLYVQMEEYAKAIEDCTEVIRLDPRHARAFNNRGGARMRLRDYSGAVEDFGQAIEIDPKHAGAYGNRGLAYQELGHLESAFRDGLKALDLTPAGSPNRNNFGENVFAACNKLHEAKSFRLAIEGFAKLTELFSGQDLARRSAYNLACAHALMGDKSKAIDWLEKAVDSGFTDVAHIENDPDLEAIRAETRIVQLLERLHKK